VVVEGVKRVFYQRYLRLRWPLCVAQPDPVPLLCSPPHLPSSSRPL